MPKRTKLLTALLLLAVATAAYAAPRTLNTVPAAGSSFLSNLQTFLRDEPAERDNLLRNPVVVEGGIGATSANLTHTVSEVTGFVNGYYVNTAAASHTYSATKRTFVYLNFDSGVTPTIATATMSYSGNFIFAEMAASTALPATPGGCLPLFYADTSAVAITSITDLRSGVVPAEAFSTLAAAITASANRTVVVSSPQRLSANLTVPSTITLDVRRVPGGALRNDGYSTTISGNLLAGPYRVFAADDPVSGLSPYALDVWWQDIQSAVSAIGATPTNLLITTRHNIVSGSSITFSPNTTLFFVHGGEINVTSGGALYCYSPIIAGGYRIFSGSGTSNFGSGTTDTTLWNRAWTEGAGSNVSGFGIGCIPDADVRLQVAGKIKSDYIDSSQSSVTNTGLPEPITKGIEVTPPCTILGPTYTSSVSFPQTISGTCLYGGWFDNQDAITGVTLTLATAKKGMSAVFLQGAYKYETGVSRTAIWVAFNAADTVLGLTNDFSAAAHALRISGGTNSALVALICMKDGVWSVTSVSGWMLDT